VRLLQSADLVLFEAAVPASILDFARRDARRMQVGSMGMAVEAEGAEADGKLVVGLVGGE
jgi:uroporphyrin-III C-methyltransferase/precorrin-2 dehydrogenase/sirohydrochlorin ferrochelatase